MAVILYQIGIFIAIQIAAMFGKNSRNTAIVLISIFTILQVFMSWLLLLQFITIYISYNVSNNLFFNKPEKKNISNKVLYSFRTENGGRGTREIDINDNSIDSEIREKARLQNQIREQSLKEYNENPNHRKAVDNVINDMFKNIPK
ncbi:hypothetical protein [Flavobacterium sp. N2270]|uniref:hypothetical protein n=1 Tax=Flavobacterium sp. N2270 TaxID=2986831 RepID=UPI0022249632|nr:hypothetical protein [Flavobacterium sp. N2270]